jgi:diaminopimelate epimerase
MTAADRVSYDRMVPFVKATACGNDFLIVDGSYAPGDMSGFSQRICDRHQGVGADGVEWLFPARDADIQARLFNSDGSEAEISGNGTRCVAAYLCAEEIEGREAGEKPAEPRHKFAIQTGAGIKTCTLISRAGASYEFETAMGEPGVGEELAIETERGEMRGIPVSMGNPHYVIFVQEYASNWREMAAEIGRSGNFKDGVNVELVVVKDRNTIETRFFERGVGETQSSGTGSCAAAVASVATGRTTSPVQVHAPGGTQAVRWEEQVFLRGQARLVCRGEYLL